MEVYGEIAIFASLPLRWRNCYICFTSTAGGRVVVTISGYWSFVCASFARIINYCDERKYYKMVDRPYAFSLICSSQWAIDLIQ